MPARTGKPRAAHADFGQAGRQSDHRAGANRVLTLDLHAGQIQGFFDIPTDNLSAVPVMSRDVKAKYKQLANVMVVSPDVGGVVRARALAKRIDAQLAIVDKRRERPGESEVMNIIGDVRGKDCLLFDDIVDSGGTLCNAAEALAAKGATERHRLYHPWRAVGRRRRPASPARKLRSWSSPTPSSRRSALELRRISACSRSPT